MINKIFSILEKRIYQLTIDLRQDIISRFTEAGGLLRVKSALNPALWLCAIVSVPSLMISAFMINPPQWIDWIIIAPVFLAVLGYLFLLLFDRDKLQSEEYQIRKKTLELIEQKGMSGPLTVSAIETIVTPDVLKLPKKPKADQ